MGRRVVKAVPIPASKPEEFVKHWRTLLWIVFLIAVGVVGIDATGKRQPRYAGRPLDYWVFQCEDHRDAEKALRAIGTNALPYLLDWIARERPSWKEKFCQAIRMVYDGLDYGQLGRFYHREETQAWNALGAFAMLGEIARPAVPELARRLEDPSPAVQFSAMEALGRVGKDGVPPLVQALTNQAKPFLFRYNAILGLWDSGTNASSAIPAIIKCLDDKNSNVAANSALLLGRMGMEPESVVPALTNCLRSSDGHLQWAAAEALGYFGPRASPAVSLLHDIITEAGPSTRMDFKSAAKEALFKIEAEKPR